MKRRNGKILGLAIGQKSILIAEVGGKAGAWSVHHVAEFHYPENADLEKPVELGQALRALLKSERFSTRDAVIGLPAKRLVTRRKEVPPASAAVAASTLRLQAESEFSTETDTLTMDFAGDTSPSEPTAVLLVAATRECIAQCESMAHAAGLKLLGITSTGTALGRATSRVPGGNGVVVNLAPGGSELIVQHGDSPTALRHLNMGDRPSAESLGLLAGEIRRSVAALPRNGSPLTLAIWEHDSNKGPGSTRNLLEERLSMPVATPELHALTSAKADAPNQFAPAIAIAIVSLEADRLPVDFLDSRLAPPPPPTNSRRIAWGVAFGLLALIVIGASLYDLNSKQQQLDSDRAYLKSHADQIKQVKTEQARRDTVRNFNPGTPRMVACLRDVTTVFPDENSIYATSINLTPQADGTYKGQLAGKAANEQNIQQLTARMSGNKNFSNVSNPDTRRDNNRGTDEFTFSISFIYHPTE
ncbi:MAG TPA: pilus assembly protein PilM [Phycisphaerae bacterium]|nr:pilus assembly protein PilM [Phycisphaerae bacterium]